MSEISIQSILNNLRLPVGRWTVAFLGLSVVAFLVIRSGLHTVLLTLSHASQFFPWILVLEGGIAACSICAVRVLYGKDRHRIPIKAFLRTGLTSYSIMGLLPAGRVIAEATRATLLAPYSTAARAAAVATHMQVVALLANAAISIPAAIALFSVLGLGMPTMLIIANLALTSALGAGILFAGQHSQIGAWLRAWSPKYGKFGQELNRYLSEEKKTIFEALGWELLGRMLQVLQNGILVVAVGGKFGITPALCSEALHLIGTATGDLIPAQIGATELSYQLSASALSLRPNDAISIALLAHAAQLVWIVIGLLVPVFWRLDLESRFSQSTS